MTITAEDEVGQLRAELEQSRAIAAAWKTKAELTETLLHQSYDALIDTESDLTKEVLLRAGLQRKVARLESRRPQAQARRVMSSAAPMPRRVRAW